MWNGTEFNKNLETLGKIVNGVEEVGKKHFVVLFHREVNGELGWYKNREDVNDRKYEGDFLNGTPNGQGTLTWSDGRKYVGEWKGGKINGQGTFTWPNGEKFEGKYKDGKYHGQGTYTHPNGKKYEGEYKDGKFHGQGTYISSDGTKYIGEWMDGKMWNGTEYDIDPTD